MPSHNQLPSHRQYLPISQRHLPISQRHANQEDEVVVYQPQGAVVSLSHALVVPQLQVAVPKPKVKLDKRAKRQRRNRRLIKLLSPKNAVMVLNELRVNVKYTVFPPMNVLATPVFMAHAELNGVIHEGKGVSMGLAKQKAAEHALRELLRDKLMSCITHMGEDNLGGTPGGDDVAYHPGDNHEADDVGEDGDELADVNYEDIPTGEEGMPWRHLASFALCKMFLEWQEQPPISINTGKPAIKHRPLKKLPDLATAKLRDPVMLLCQLVPGIKFSEAKRTGKAPRITFTMEVEVQGTKYRGTGSTKKIAKKAAAKRALAVVCSITYDD